MTDSILPLLPEKGCAYEPIDGGGNDDEQKTSNNEAFGYMLMLAASLSLKISALITRTVTLYYDVSVQNMLFLRGLTLTLLGLVYAFTAANPRDVFYVPRPLMPLLAIRGFLGAASLAVLYWATSLLPLYLVTTLFFLNPFFTMILSGVFLGERVTTRELFAAGFSLVGVALVGKPSFDATGMMQATSLLGAGLAVIAAGIVSLAYISIRALGNKVHFLTSLLSFGFTVTIFGVALGGAALPGLTKGVLIALGGCVVGFFGQCCVNLGFQYCRASTGTLLRTADVPFAYLLGLVFLGEIPRLVSIFGSALVITGTIIVGLAAMRKQPKILLATKPSRKVVDIQV